MAELVVGMSGANHRDRCPHCGDAVCWTAPSFTTPGEYWARRDQAFGQHYRLECKGLD